MKGVGDLFHKEGDKGYRSGDKKSAHTFSQIQLKGVMYQVLGAGYKVLLFLGRGLCFQ